MPADKRFHVPMTRRMPLAAAIVALVVVPAPLAGPVTASAAAVGPSARSDDPQSTDNLDPVLLAEMRRQNELQPALAAIWDAQMQNPNSGFAGVAYEGNGLTLYWKGSLTPEISAVFEAERTLGTVTVKAAANSEAELHAAGRRIHAAIDRHGGSDIQSISYAPDGSGLQIIRGPEVSYGEPDAMIRPESSNRTSVEQILAEAQVDVPVQVTDAAEPLDLLASRLNDSSPWNGGGRWESWRGLDHRMNCTTGFGVHAGGRSYVLSAGHCATPPDDAYQGKYGGAFHEMGPPVYDDDWRSDLLLINAPGWYRIFDGSATTSTTKVVRSWGYWAANELVCQSGMTSGTVCGIRQQSSTDLRVSCNSPDSDGDCDYTIYGVIRSTQVNGSTAARGGDSGGPVFTLDGTGVRAKGIVSGGGGSTLYFQDWADVIRVYGAYPNTNSSAS